MSHPHTSKLSSSYIRKGKKQVKAILMTFVNPIYPRYHFNMESIYKVLMRSFMPSFHPETWNPVSAWHSWHTLNNGSVGCTS